MTAGSKSGYKKLMGQRNIDVVFIDVGSEAVNHHELLGSSVLNYTTGNVEDLPGVLSKVSDLLARKSGKCRFKLNTVDLHRPQDRFFSRSK